VPAWKTLLQQIALPQLMARPSADAPAQCFHQVDDVASGAEHVAALRASVCAGYSRGKFDSSRDRKD